MTIRRIDFPDRLLEQAALVAVLASILYVGYAMSAVFPRWPLVNPDTPGYLEYAWHRSVGYPLFLSAIYASAGNLYAAVPVQAGLAIGAIVYFFYQTGHLYRRPALALFAAVPFILSSTLLGYDYAILSEALFMALLLFASGALLRVLRRPDTWPMLLCGLSAGAAVSVKPIGVVLLLFPLMLLLQCRGRRKAVVTYAIAPALGLVAVLAAYNAATLGSPSLFLRGGMSLFAGTAHLHQAGSTTDVYAPIVDELAAKTRPFMEARANASSVYEMQEAKRTQHEQVAYARGSFEGLKARLDDLAASSPERFCADPVSASWSRYLNRPHPSLCRDRLQREIALHAVRTDPLGYAAYVADNALVYLGLTFHQTPFGQPEFDSGRDDALRIADRYDLNAPPETFAPSAKPETIVDTPALHAVLTLMLGKIVFDIRFYMLLGLAMGLGAAVAAVALVVAVPVSLARRRPLSRLVIGGGTLSLALWGAYAMMSLTHHAVARYVHVWQPMLLVAGALGWVLIARVAAGRMRSGHWSLQPLFNPADGSTTASGR
jgi:hypothetical protein